MVIVALQADGSGCARRWRHVHRSPGPHRLWPRLWRGKPRHSRYAPTCCHETCASALPLPSALLSPRGMALFFSSHRCNHLCRWLRLREFRLCHAEKHALNAVDTSGAASHNTMTADDTGVSAGSGSGSTGSRMSTGHRRYKSWTRHATVLRVRKHAASSTYVVQLPSLMCVCVCVCVVRACGQSCKSSETS